MSLNDFYSETFPVLQVSVSYNLYEYEAGYKKEKFV